MNKKTAKLIFIALLIPIAVALIVLILHPVIIRVTGDAMDPVLKRDDIVLCAADDGYGKSDCICYYCEGKILCGRIIGCEGDNVSVSSDGRVFINDFSIDEPYAVYSSEELGDIEYPYTVGQGRFFVMGDNRGLSVDSRFNDVGAVPYDSIIGRTSFRLLPLSRFGTIERE